MSNTVSYTQIFVGKTGISVKPAPKPYVVPKQWRPLLALAYAYTTNSINQQLVDILDVGNTVAQHTEQIDNLTEQLTALSALNNEEFIEKIQELAGKIDEIDPDLLLSLAYTYTMVISNQTLTYSYIYADTLYDDAITRSYDKIDNIYNTLEDELNSSITSLNNSLSNYATTEYVDETFAVKDDIPTRVSQLDNDKGL